MTALASAGCQHFETILRRRARAVTMGAQAARAVGLISALHDCILRGGHERGAARGVRKRAWVGWGVKGFTARFALGKALRRATCRPLAGERTSGRARGRRVSKKKTLRGRAARRFARGKTRRRAACRAFFSPGAAQRRPGPSLVRQFGALCTARCSRRRPIEAERLTRPAPRDVPPLPRRARRLLRCSHLPPRQSTCAIRSPADGAARHEGAAVRDAARAGR